MKVRTLLTAVGVGAATALAVELIMPQQMDVVRHQACRAMNAVEDGVSKAADALL